MEIPKTQMVTLNDAERFCLGLKMLAEECNMTHVIHNKLGILKFEFMDGSAVGGLGAYISAGIIKEQ